MRSSFSRVLRFSGFAAAGLAVVLPAFAAAQRATQTSLTAETHDTNGRTQAALSIHVAGEDGQPASGPVVIEDGARQLAGVALDARGNAALTVDLPPGRHALRAVFAGDADNRASASIAAEVQAQTSAIPDFAIAVNPASISLTAGQSGTLVASVTPVNASALTAPMFVTLSCSGTPDQSSCAFTPENVEILPNATTAVNSTLVITTQAGTGSVGMVRPPGGSAPVSWAILLPGALGFGGFAFALRRRRWLSRLSLMGLVALVTILGATGCAPRYNYFNHGPPHNRPTPAGNYTLTISAQSSDGVTATTHFAKFALTVK
ncbi:MAG TPA: Ig-like domain-containing protein [Terracidiphilus sp.]